MNAAIAICAAHRCVGARLSSEMDKLPSIEVSGCMSSSDECEKKHSFRLLLTAIRHSRRSDDAARRSKGELSVYTQFTAHYSMKLSLRRLLHRDMPIHYQL